MKLHALSSTLLALLLTTWSAEGGSFLRDVVGKRDTKPNKEQVLNNDLLAKAIPFDQYRAQLKEQGLYLPMDQDHKGRRLEQNQGNIKYYYYNYYGDDDQVQVQYYKNENDDQPQQDANGNDDYYVSNDDFLDFDGYSLKYAKCQPVQRFSASAVEAGEYSPMVINDIVILRLCPSYYCSNSRDYGCLYDYAEYAIDLTDYVRVMLRYQMDQNGQMCDWCQYCVAGRRKLANNNYYNYDDGYNQAAAGDDGNVNYNDDAAAAAGDDAAVVDDAYAAVEYPEGCEDYESYCLDGDGYSVCDQENANGNAGDDGVEYMATENYLDIIGCTQVNGAYYVRPRCDGSSNTIAMAVYYDRFCTWYGGDDVDIDSFGLGIDQSIFESFSSTGCLDCSQSNYPPYFNSNSNLCNRIDITSARCTSSLGTELFAYNATNVTYSDEKECNYIDSLRSGTYDSEGKLYSEEVAGEFNRKVTETQKWLLGVVMAVCGLLAVYSCYLHHAITNLLIKSLSHTDLLPPSRHRRRSSSASRRRGRRSRKPVDEDEDDDENFEVRGSPIAA